MQWDKKYRVAHIGTGYTGAIALRQVLRSPRSELVGQLVNSSDKVGRDSGELAGESAVGILASDAPARCSPPGLRPASPATSWPCMRRA